MTYAVFGGCTSLESLTFPTRIDYLGADSFYGCTSLTNLSIEFEENASIQLGAFKGCERFCHHIWEWAYCGYCETTCSHPSWNNGHCDVCGYYFDIGSEDMGSED